MTLTNINKNSIQLNRDAPEWLPIEITEQYNKTDLGYDFCLKLFGQLEAVKREKFPPETMRQWFIEFVRKGWTKKMVQKRYDALLGTKIYGIEKLEFADWVNAVEVFGYDEMNLKVERKINSMIHRGAFLKSHPDIELTEEDKKCLELEIAHELEFKRTNDLLDKKETWKQERKRLIMEKYQ